MHEWNTELFVVCCFIAVAFDLVIKHLFQSVCCARLVTGEQNLQIGEMYGYFNVPPPIVSLSGGCTVQGVSANSGSEQAEHMMLQN